MVESHTFRRITKGSSNTGKFLFGILFFVITTSVVFLFVQSRVQHVQDKNLEKDKLNTPQETISKRPADFFQKTVNLDLPDKEEMNSKDKLGYTYVVASYEKQNMIRISTDDVSQHYFFRT